MRFLIGCAALLLAIPGLGLSVAGQTLQGPGVSGDASREIRVNGNDADFRIVADAGARSIRLYHLGGRETAPRDVSIRLFRDDQLLQEITMSALSGQTAGSGPIEYTGKLDPSASSFAGLEVRFGIKGSKAPRVVRWDEDRAAG